MPKLQGQIDLPFIPANADGIIPWVKAFTDRIQRAWRTLTYTVNALSQVDTFANRPATPTLDHSFFHASDTGNTYVGVSGVWQAIGGYGGSIASKTTAYTAAVTDSVILCNATGAAFTVTLPTAASMTNKIFVVIKTDGSGNAVTVDGNGAETINGAANQALAAQYNGLTIISNGTTWFIIP